MESVLDTSTLSMLQLPPPLYQFPPRGRGFSTKEDQLFTNKLTFYFNNCPKVQASAFTCVIFEEPEKFVCDVRSIRWRHYKTFPSPHIGTILISQPGNCLCLFPCARW